MTHFKHITHAALKVENSIKSFSYSINPCSHYGNRKSSISMCPSYWLKSWCVTWLLCCITTLHFQLLVLWTLSVTVQAKNSVTNTPVSVAKSCTEAMMHTLQIITYEVVEKNGAQRRTKVSFVRTMMQALELVQLVKRHILGQNRRNQSFSCSHNCITLVWRH